ncbi:DUF4232 domain-containing protein [Streptomyces sp. NBC_00669]|uniref:DUF4232 domain-containing protein n=1 Tax=Streptomyces sp. NBC_00669 TaxID=2976011 RepID=UPI002E366497|nr:DUF4232 domain-containing protein [Streptomyces sp. NBC_00669]
MTGFPDGPAVPDGSGPPEESGPSGTSRGSGGSGGSGASGGPGGRVERANGFDRLGGLDDPSDERAGRDIAGGRDVDRDLDDGPGSGRDDGTDPLARLLRPAGGYLSAPPGTFERIRRRAARRRRVRALAGGTAVAAVIAGALFVTGVVTPDGDRTIGPPADHSLASSGPAPSGRPTATPSEQRASGGSGTHTPAAPTSPTPSAGDTAGAPGTVPTTAPTTPDTSPLCTAAQLTATLGGGDAGAGNLYRYLVITNTSGTTCRVAGYPGLSMLDANGKQIGQPATRRKVSYSPVVLKPGGSASDTIHTINQQGTCLATSAQLKMYPPGSKASLKFTGQITDCDDMFEITPFTAGKTGNPPS